MALPSDDAVVESAAAAAEADIFAEEEEARPAPGTDADATKPEAGESNAANAAAVNRISREEVDMRTAGCNNNESCAAVLTRCGRCGRCGTKSTPRHTHAGHLE